MVATQVAENKKLNAVFGDLVRLEVEQADARTLITLLHLRDLRDAAGPLAS